MGRLTEKNENGYGYSKESLLSYDENGCINGYSEHCLKAIWKLAEYEDLEEQGLLLRLPCNVGDYVYTNVSVKGWYMRKKDRPYKAKIVFMGINGVDNFINVTFGKGMMFQFNFSQIGKKVFLTKEEAEQALEKMKEGENDE